MCFRAETPAPRGAPAVAVHERGDNIKSVGSVSLELAVNIAEAAGGRVRVEPEVVIDEADLRSVFLGEAG